MTFCIAKPHLLTTLVSSLRTFKTVSLVWGMAEGPVLKLHAQLLAEVLQHVPLQHRLGSCALVCSTWRAAAAVATKSLDVTVKWGNKDTLACLSTWLGSHPVKACISSIRVHVPNCYSGQQLLLPLLQLQGLQVLHLDTTLWGSADEPSAAAGHPAQQGPTAASESAHSSTANLAALTALTSLKLHQCAVNVAGLQALTRLRELEVHRAAVGRESFGTGYC